MISDAEQRPKKSGFRIAQSDSDARVNLTIHTLDVLEGRTTLAALGGRRGPVPSTSQRKQNACITNNNSGR